MSQRTRKRKVTPEHMARAARLPHNADALEKIPLITSCWSEEQTELQAENAQLRSLVRRLAERLEREHAVGTYGCDKSRCQVAALLAEARAATEGK